MLHLVLVAVACVVVLIAIIKLFYPQRSSSSATFTIPGLDPDDPIEGNKPSIAKAGSYHEFLKALHDQFGDIASFWMGEQRVVSIASPALFKQQSQYFDRPPKLFKAMEPLITSNSIQFTNGDDGRNRRSQYDRCFSHDAVMAYHDTFKEVTEELVHKLEKVSPEDHVPLMENVFTVAIKSITITNFGSYFKDDTEVLKFWKNYNITWGEVEAAVDGKEPDSERMKRFEEAKKDMYDTIQGVIEKGRNDPASDHGKAFLDVILASGVPDSQIRCDVMTFWVGGFHNTAYMMTWGLYYLASNPDIQEKVYRELVDVLGDEDMAYRAIPQLKYLHQVLEETLRITMGVPFAARVEYEDIELGGHNVPAETPVLHALCVIQHDEKLWPSPNKFDPDRFSLENSKKRPNFSFEPFGFAGKRRCPGYKYSYTEATVVFAGLLRKFKFHMVPGQVITPVYGFATKPNNEIWVTVEKR